MAYDEHEERPELVKQRAKVIMLERGGLYITGTVLAVMLAFDIVNTYIAADQRATLIDCTAARGECFQNGQKRTAVAIKQIIDDNVLQEVATRRVVVLAAQCANRPGVQTANQVEDCVERGLK